MCCHIDSLARLHAGVWLCENVTAHAKALARTGGRADASERWRKTARVRPGEHGRGRARDARTPGERGEGWQGEGA